MRKKIFLALIALLALVCGMVPAASAETNCTYKNNVLTISGSGNMALSSPAQWDTYRSDIEVIVIESGVTSICNNAFRGCRSLTTVYINGNIESIGNYAFSGCNSLTTIIYGGTSEPSGRSDSLPSSFAVTIRVPAEYEGELFCEKAVVKPTVKCPECETAVSSTDEHKAACGNHYSCETGYVADNHKKAACGAHYLCAGGDHSAAACGHFQCASDFVADNHAKAACGNHFKCENGYAAAAHEICGRCGERLCNGADHTSCEPPHNYKWVYNNDASCTTDGTQTQVCSDPGCGKIGETQKAKGSAKGHLFSDYIDDNNADCVNDSTKTATCQRAGCNAKVIMVVKGSALGHDYQPDLENSRPATCIEPGKEVTTCTRCGETFFKATAMVEHTVVDLPAVEPTCTATGLTLGAKCGVCGKNMVLQEEIPMLPHTPEEVPAVEPTYTKPGKTAGEKCAVCGALLSGCEEIGVLTPKLAGLALMRKGASQDAGIYFPLLKPSQSFSIIGEMENYFYPIMLVNGTVGWLHYSYVA